MELEDLVLGASATEAAVKDLDISDLVGEAPGSTVLRFREPLVPEVFAIPELAARARIQFPTYPDALLLQICVMGICHVPGKPKVKRKTAYPSWMLFGNLAVRDWAEGHKIVGFATLSRRFDALFPHLQDMASEAAQKKSDDGESTDDDTPVRDASASDAERGDDDDGGAD